MYAKHVSAGASRVALPFAVAAACLSLQTCRASDPGPVVATRLTPGPVAASATAVPCPSPPPASPTIALVYAEPSSRTLVTAALTLAADGTATVESTVLDRIGEGADTSPDFGSHAYARIDDTEHLAYLDRAADGHLALKLLHRNAGTTTWEIDLLEPAGRPLCFLSHGSELHLLLVADGAVLMDQPLAPLQSAPAVLVRDCRPGGQLSVVRSAEGDSFAFLDAARGTVLIGQLSGASVGLSEIHAPPGARFSGPCHVRADREGRLCLFFYDGASEDLVDLRDLQGENRAVGVTRARGVTAVYASSEADETIYVYAESTVTTAGRPAYALSMLESGPAGGRSNTSYRRIDTSALPYGAIQPSVGDGELRVVALTDVLQLLRVRLRQ